MERRAFISGLAAAAVMPPAAHAQGEKRVRRIGLLMPFSAGDPEAQVRGPVFEQSLERLGWTKGANLLIEYRLAGGDPASIRRHATELVSLAPDVIVTVGALAPGPVLEATLSIPIVMVNVPDPVGAGWVQSLARPGGNATAFTNFEYTLGGKWLELLRQVAPGLKRAAVLRATSVAGIGQFAAVQSAAQSLGVELTPVGVNNAEEIDRGVMSVARADNAGLIVTGGGTGARRNFIIDLASRLKLPAIYPFRYYVADGGLISYGPDTHEVFRRAAGYVDRILKGEKPAEMPVQLPTKYELAVNLKTAKSLGLAVPATLVARADEVIE